MALPFDIGDAPSTGTPDAGQLLQIQKALQVLASSAQNYVIAKADGTPLENGAALMDAYAAAKALEPNGSALSGNNRAVLFVSPGDYDLGSTPWVVDSENVDIIALAEKRELTRIHAVIDAPNSGVIMQTAPIYMSGLTVYHWGNVLADNTSATPCALYVEDEFESTWVNCAFISSRPGYNDSGYGYPMRAGITIGGTFTDCATGKYGFGYMGTASGTYTRCSGGMDSFASRGVANGNFIDCQCSGPNGFAGGGVGTAGTASGNFINCTAGNYSFGAHASGTFTRCAAGLRAFGSSSAAGTFQDCTAGDDSFGFDIASGQFYNCIGGDACFGFSAQANTTGSFEHCTGGANSFGGGGGRFAGKATFCVAGADSFGGGAGGVLTGSLYYCHLTAGQFTTPIGAGLLRFCIDGNDNTGMETTGVRCLTVVDAGSDSANGIYVRDEDPFPGTEGMLYGFHGGTGGMQIIPVTLGDGGWEIGSFVEGFWMGLYGTAAGQSLAGPENMTWATPGGLSELAGVAPPPAISVTYIPTVTVSGLISPPGNGVLLPAGSNDGSVCYSSDGTMTPALSGFWTSLKFVAMDGIMLEVYENGFLAGIWLSLDGGSGGASTIDIATASDFTGIEDATGTPVLT